MSKDTATIDEVLAMAERNNVNIRDYSAWCAQRNKARDERSLQDFILEQRATPFPKSGWGDFGTGKANFFSDIRDAISNQGNFSEPAKERSRHIANTAGVEARGSGIMVPAGEILGTRALSASVGSAGGFLVGEDVRPDLFVDALRKRSVIEEAGARTITGLRGNANIPTASSGNNVTWAAEGAAVASSDMTFGSIGVTPHRMTFVGRYSKQWIMQSSPDAESIVRNDAIAAMNEAKDDVAINGTGAAGEPLGLIGAVTATSVTFGAAPTWAKVLSFESNVATNNADTAGMAYITTPSTRAKFKETPKVSGDPSAGFLWDSDNRVNGYRALSTTHVPSNRVIFGDFTQCAWCVWDAMEVLINPYTYAANNQVEIVLTAHLDFVTLRPAESFSISTDAGNQ